MGPFHYQPHMVCYGGNIVLTLAMAFADAGIALSYFGLSSILFYVLKNKRIEMKAVGMGFVAFILACGLGHLAHLVAIFYAGAFFLWWTAVEFLLTAVISAYTCVATWMAMRDIRKTLHAFANYQQTVRDQAWLEEQQNTGVEQHDETLKALARLNTTADRMIQLKVARGA